VCRCVAAFPPRPAPRPTLTPPPPSVLASGDVVNAELKLSEFAALDYTFQGTLEGNLAEAVCAACAATDAAAFATACAEYDKIKRLDPWHTGLLLAIKKMHGEEDGGEDEDLT